MFDAARKFFSTSLWALSFDLSLLKRFPSSVGVLLSGSLFNEVVPEYSNTAELLPLALLLPILTKHRWSCSQVSENGTEASQSPIVINRPRLQWRDGRTSRCERGPRPQGDRQRETEGFIVDRSTWRQGKSFGPACHFFPHLVSRSLIQEIAWMDWVCFLSLGLEMWVDQHGILQFSSKPHFPSCQTADYPYNHRLMRGSVAGQPG